MTTLTVISAHNTPNGWRVRNPYIPGSVFVLWDGRSAHAIYVDNNIYYIDTDHPYATLGYAFGFTRRLHKWHILLTQSGRFALWSGKTVATCESTVDHYGGTIEVALGGISHDGDGTTITVIWQRIIAKLYIRWADN